MINKQRFFQLSNNPLPSISTHVESNSRKNKKGLCCLDIFLLRYDLETMLYYKDNPLPAKTHKIMHNTLCNRFELTQVPSEALHVLCDHRTIYCTTSVHDQVLKKNWQEISETQVTKSDPVSSRKISSAGGYILNRLN